MTMRTRYQGALRAPWISRRLAIGISPRRAVDILAGWATAGTGLLLLVVVWYAAAAATPGYILPYPQTVLLRLADWFWEAPRLRAYGLAHTGILPNILDTMRTVLSAQAIGLIAGSVLGLASARSDLLRAALNPVIVITTAIPILVLAPFFLIWFGVGRTGTMLLVLVYAVNLFVIYSQRGADNLDPVYEQNALALGASRWRVLCQVLIPGALPEILGGLRISMSGAWGLVAISELLGSSSGIGTMIRVLVGQFDVTGILAAIVAVCAIALMFDAAIVLARRSILKWRNE